jgi:hypothetical protein
MSNLNENEPIVWVRRQYNDCRHAAYRLSDVWDLHWDNKSGGVQARANRYYLHGYVLCTAMIEGEIAHSCRHGRPPHQIKVCITKVGNEKVFPQLLALAPKG